MLRAISILALLAAVTGCPRAEVNPLAEAWALYEAGKPAEARVAAHAAAGRKWPQAPDLARLADLLVELGEPERAIAVAGERAAERGAEAVLVEAVAFAKLKAGDLAGAIVALDGLVREGRDTARTHFLLGMMALARRDSGAARRELTSARRLDPESPPTEALFGWLLFMEGHAPEALAELSEAWRRFPESPEVASTFAQVLLTAKGSDPPSLTKAADLLAVVVKKRPLDLGSRRNLGTALNRLNRCMEAEAVFTPLCAELPNDAACWTGLGVARVGRGKVPEAVEAFRKAEGLAPRDIGILMNLGNGYLALCRVAADRKDVAERARTIFERVKDMAPNLPDVYVGLARAELKANPGSDEQATKAMELYRRALSLDAGHYEANLNLALLYYDIWNFDKRPEGEGYQRAKEHFERAAKQVPPEFWDPLARQAYEEIRKR